MKCSSRRNCNEAGVLWLVTTKGLNEVQLPKELQHGHLPDHHTEPTVSMKCSSRRNCNYVFVPSRDLTALPQ